MDKIKDAKKYHGLYLRGLITQNELSKAYKDIVLDTSARVEKCLASIPDSICGVAYNTPSELDGYARQIVAQLYIMWKLGLIGFDDYARTACHVENMAKDIQSDYDNWRREHKQYRRHRSIL